MEHGPLTAVAASPAQQDAGVVAAVIPAFRVAGQILDVIRGIGPEVGVIVVVDDACPERSGALVRARCTDPRVHVVTHERNQGVGGAMVTGYLEALRRGASVLVKIDGDGQMDPAGVRPLIAPILAGKADYAKGNRFYNPRDVRSMPTVRLVGNAGLSFLTKVSSGYWNIFDPTNGFTALHAALVPLLAFERMERRYFFETEMLYRLRLVNARVADVPMPARYGTEASGLRPGRVMLEFLGKNIRNAVKRVFYMYFLRDFTVASLYLLVGLPLALFGLAFGLHEWHSFSERSEFASAGTVMLAAIPFVLGSQLLLSFLAYDVEHVPRDAIHPALADSAAPASGASGADGDVRRA